MIELTHEVVRRRGGLVMRQFRSEEAARAWAKRLRARFKRNQYVVREVAGN